MIYKTKGIKQTRKYGRKYKRNMRGGGFGENGGWSMALPIFVLLAAITMILVLAFGNIVKGGGTSKPQ